MSGDHDSEMMDRPSLPSSGLADLSTLGTQSPATGTPHRETFSERMKRGLQERMAKEMEGLSREDDWDAEIADDSKLKPVVGSRSLPLRGGDAPHTSQEMSKFALSDETESDDSDDQQSTAQGSLSLLPLGKNVHVVLTPLVPTVRDIHDLQLKKNSPLVRDFLENIQGTSSQALKKIDKFVENLKLIGDHQDLVAGISDSQQNLSNDTIFKWAINCSPKCLFLERLFETLRFHSINIAVLARPGMTLDILTSMLEGQKISYVRPDGPKEGFFHGDLRVTLLPTGFEDGQYVVSPVDAVIAFDSSFFTGEVYTTLLRSDPVDPNLMAPLIALVADQSVEHIELCLSKNMDPAERKACLCSLIMQKREVVGRYTEPRPENAAPLVAHYLVESKEAESANEVKWPLDQNTDVYNLEIPSEYLQDLSGGSTQPLSTSISKNSQRATNKRTRNVADEESTKRMRMTPIEDQPSSEDVSRVADSASLPTGSTSTQVQPDPASHWTFAQVIADRAERAAKYAEQHAGLLATISDLRAKLQTMADSEARVSELEAEIRDKDELDNNLRQVLRGVEARLAEHIDIVNKFQPAYQELTLERNKAARELRECEDRAAALSKRLDARSNELSNVQLTINKTQEELKAARNQLILSSVPEIRELEELRQKLKTAEEEKDKAERRYQSLNRDFEFTKEQYQKASSSAGAFSREVDDLREQNQLLQRKADENKVKIQQIQAESAQTELLSRIEQLKAEITELKDQLLKKAEELKKRGDRSLRGVSGPQSPMMGQFGGYGRNGVGN